MHGDMEHHTVKMLRVPPATRVDTDTRRIPIIPVKEDEVFEDINDQEPYDYEGNDDFVPNKSGGFRDRQIAYMTAVVVWFLVLSVLGVVATFVWKLCATIVG